MPVGKMPPAAGRFPLLFEHFIKKDVERGIRSTHVLAHTFGSSANTEERIRHRLGRTPKAFTVLDKSAACDIYRGDTFWDRWFVYMKSSVGGVKVSLELS